MIMNQYSVHNNIIIILCNSNYVYYYNNSYTCENKYIFSCNTVISFDYKISIIHCDSVKTNFSH